MIEKHVQLKWDLSKEDIEKATEDLIQTSRAVFDAVGSLKEEELTFNNLLKVCTERLPFGTSFVLSLRFTLT